MSQTAPGRRFHRWMAAALLVVLAALLLPAAPATAQTSDSVVLAQAAEPKDSGTEAIESSSSWVGTGAANALDWALRKLLDEECSFLSTECRNTAWFDNQYGVMRAMAIWVMVPLVLISIIHAIAKGSMELMLKSVLIYLPIAVLGSVVAIKFVSELIEITDDVSRVFARATAEDLNAYFSNIFTGLLDNKGSFLVFFVVGPLLIVVSITMYIILVLREASIYIATAFLPIGFATLVWPSVASYFRKLCEFLFAMIFSKLVIVAGVSLAVAGMAGTTVDRDRDENQVAISISGTPVATQNVAATAPTENAAAGDTEGDTTDWLFQSLQAVVLLGVVSITPTMLVKLAGNVGFDGASAALGTFLNRPGVTNQIILANRVFAEGGIIDSVRKTGTNVGAYRNAKKEAHTTSMEDQRLSQLGVHKSGEGDAANYAFEAKQLEDLGFSSADATELAGFSQSENPDAIAVAHLAVNMGAANYAGHNLGTNSAYTAINRKDEQGSIYESVAVPRIHDDQGNRVDYYEPTLIGRIADQERARLNNLAASQKVAQNPNVRIMSSLNLRDPRQQKNAQAMQNAVSTYRERHGNIKNVRLVFDGNLTRRINPNVGADAPSYFG